MVTTVHCAGWAQIDAFIPSASRVDVCRPADGVSLDLPGSAAVALDDAEPVGLRAHAMEGAMHTSIGFSEADAIPDRRAVTSCCPRTAAAFGSPVEGP